MKAVDNVLKDAILNGLYNKNENKGNEFISPQLVNNDDQSKIWFTLPTRINVMYLFYLGSCFYFREYARSL